MGRDFRYFYSRIFHDYLYGILFDNVNQIWETFLNSLRKDKFMLEKDLDHELINDQKVI